MCPGGAALWDSVKQKREVWGEEMSWKRKYPLMVSLVKYEIELEDDNLYRPSIKYTVMASQSTVIMRASVFGEMGGLDLIYWMIYN